MPRSVDHDQRRDELAAAVWRLARADGFSALTVRRVAEEAGWTTGVVQHYFPSKAALLLYAFELVQRRTVARMAEIGAREDAGAALRATVFTLLPLDDEIRAESEVWFGFLGLALGDGELREAAERGHMQILELITEQVRRAQEAGVIRGEEDPQAVALELLALADGLNVRSLFRRGETRPGELRRVMEDRLAGLAPDAT